MKKNLIVLAIAGCAAMGANAASVSFTDTASSRTTNWTDTLTLSQFDASLGTLTSIEFTYGGDVTSIFRNESLDAADATITLNAKANLVFGTPLSETLVVTNTETQGVSAYDGVVDFGGTSGFEKSVTGFASSALTLFTGFGAYTGLGTYGINVGANGLSNASGAGNLISQINTQASGWMTVKYIYEDNPPVDPPNNVPEPGSLALMGLALAGMGMVRRKTK